MTESQIENRIKKLQAIEWFDNSFSVEKQPWTYKKTPQTSAFASLRGFVRGGYKYFYVCLL